MSDDANPKSSPAREGQPSSGQPMPGKPAKSTPKRKVASRKISVDDELAAARRTIREGQEAEARALARKDQEAKAIRAQRGRASIPDLVGRLDPTILDMVSPYLIGVAKDEEKQNLQEWLATL